MMGLNFDLSGFHIKLMAAIVYTVGALFAFAMFPLFNGAAQGFHLEARQEGSCETKAGVRFDRVVWVSASDSTPTANPHYNGGAGETEDPNKYNWSDGGADVTASSTAGKCQTAAAVPGSAATGKLMAADGTIINVAGATAAIPSWGDNTKWASPANFLQDNRTIVNVVIGVLVLIIGIGPIAILGGIGKYLLDTFAGGLSGAMKFLVATLGAVIAVTLLGTFVEFIDLAYDAVSADRYTMYDVSIASLAGTIKQYWGLIFIAGWVALGSYFGWQAFQKFRGGSGSGSGSQVMG